MKKNVFNARTHNYKTAREKALSNNHIPENVYDNNVKLYINIYHCYIDILKYAKNLLGLDDLKMYDLYTPLIKDINAL
ncbi:hypothetical protein ACVNPZ_10455 [Staphylococcus aureus]